jgi:hypothetical protein
VIARVLAIGPGLEAILLEQAIGHELAGIDRIPVIGPASRIDQASTTDRAQVTVLPLAIGRGLAPTDQDLATDRLSAA